MNKEIILQVKNVYGNDLIYPSCHIANALIKLKKEKHLVKNDLNVFKSLGLIIKWKAGSNMNWNIVLYIGLVFYVLMFITLFIANEMDKRKKDREQWLSDNN